MSIIYINILTSSKLNEHLQIIDDKAMHCMTD
ncbi:hypothetical protein [Longibaculum muris]|nr:hypothetical protein [Longibaculum muris]